ncbi:MAG: efflux transporter periplasmic adaptor subunit, partial [Rhodothermales bacterium]|nr:efflux transporter periplasmic adaptor subunit [Rhodothermales bacterium]
MNKTGRTVLLVALAATIGAAGFFAGRSIGNRSAPATDERAIAYWRAPMDPTEVYDGPGQSRMGMDLVPVYEDELSGGDARVSIPDGFVEIDPRVAQNMGVRSTTVQRKSFSRQIRTVGEVGYDEERLFVVNTKISGWIEKLNVNYVGDTVRENEPLLEIYSPELVSTQEEYLLALQNVRNLPNGATPSIRADAERLLAAARSR